MYELIKVAPRTYYIDGPSIIGVYLIDEALGQVCFIDSGPSDSAAKAAEAILQAQGWSLTAIIQTHSHADHVGGSFYLQNKTGCQVLAYGYECDFVNHTILEPTYLHGGYPHRHLRSRLLMAKPCSCTPLTESNCPPGLRFVSLPGHAMDMVAVATSDDIWFMGDVAVSQEVLLKYRIGFLFNVEQFLQSLETASQLQGQLFILSHLPPQKNIESLLDFNRQAVVSILDLLLDICRTPSNSETIISQVFSRLSMDINLTQYALVGSTIRSYLSHLGDNKRLKVSIVGTDVLWSLPEEVEDGDGALDLAASAEAISQSQKKPEATSVTPESIDLTRQIIVTERLILRPVDSTFVEPIYHCFTPEMVRYMIPPPNETRQAARTFITASSTAMQAGSALEMVVLDKNTCEFLGCCCLNSVNTLYPEIGIWIKQESWHNRYGMEAVVALVEWARAFIKFKYLIYPVDMANLASRKIPEYLGGKICRRYKEVNASGFELDVAEYRIF